MLAGGGAVAVFILLVCAYVLVMPYWAPGRLTDLALQSMGRGFAAAGGGHLEFGPLAIRIDDAVLSGPEGSADSFVKAGAVIVPVTFGQLLSRQPDFSAITLRDAEIALLIDERGEASWDLHVPATGAAMKITLERAALRYFDARNNQALALDPVEGLLEIRPDGSMSFNGSAVIAGELVRASADLRSLARVNTDGSPLDLALTAPSGTLTFSGRLATSKALNLAGPLSLAGPDLAGLLSLTAGPAAAAMPSATAFSLEGALDSAGRAFAIRKAVLMLGGFGATGDLAVDLRGERPRLQANLAAASLPVDQLVPASGAGPLDWGRRSIPFALLRMADADITLRAETARYGSLTTAATQLNATLADGRLSVSGDTRLATGGGLGVAVGLDAAALPPQASVSLQADETGAQPLLAALTGVTQLAGAGGFSAELTASGTTQEEMVGTLAGTARLALRDGSITGSDLPALMVAATTPVTGWTAGAGATPFKTLSGEVALADGIATIRQLTIATGSTVLAISGTGDLLRRAVDVTVVASPESGAAPTAAVGIRGKWDAPAIGPAPAPAGSLPATGN